MEIDKDKITIESVKAIIDNIETERKYIERVMSEVEYNNTRTFDYYRGLHKGLTECLQEIRYYIGNFEK